MEKKEETTDSAVESSNSSSGIISLGAKRKDDLQLSAVGDNNLFGGFARVAAEALDLPHDIHALDDAAEHDVAVIEPGSLHGRDEELGAVGVRAGVSHRENARAGVLQGEVLVLELVAVDRLATGAVVVLEVATLAHEVRDHAVEDRAFVAETLLAGAERAEVLARLRDDIGTQLDDDPTEWLVIHGHVEKAARQSHLFRKITLLRMKTSTTLIDSRQLRGETDQRLAAAALRGG